MKNVLVLGAGQSATYLIRYLLEQAEEQGWFVTVGDRDLALAERAVAGHPCGDAIAFDVTDGDMRTSHVARSELVVHLLPQHFQSVIARDCVQQGRHMISVSYQDRSMAEIAADAQRKGVLLLTEVGLDPGIDLMSAMEIIDRVHDRGGVVESFESYGSGVPAPEVKTNPLRYCITWNPRNVVMAGEQGAQYLEYGKIKIVPWHQLFHHSWIKQVEGYGDMEAYPNRDSLAYRDKFGIPDTQTMIRGTLRYPGWSETWHQIVRLGLPNEEIAIPNLAERSFRQIVEMFLPETISGSTLEWRVASYLGISMTGRIMQNLKWLGFFSPEPMGIEGTTAADAMIFLLKKKLVLPEGGRDSIILLHDVIARYPEEERRERIVSTLVHFGEPGVTTGMARTVGLPAGIAVRLILSGELPLTGCHIPTHPAIYRPILRELEAEGLAFDEKVEELGDRPHPLKKEVAS